MRVNSTGETRRQHRKRGGAGFHQRPPLYSYQLPLLFPFRDTELLLLRRLRWSVTLREELGALECSPLAFTHHSANYPASGEPTRGKNHWHNRARTSVIPSSCGNGVLTRPPVLLHPAIRCYHGFRTASNKRIASVKGLRFCPP